MHVSVIESRQLLAARLDAIFGLGSYITKQIEKKKIGCSNLAQPTSTLPTYISAKDNARKKTCRHTSRRAMLQLLELLRFEPYQYDKQFM